MCNNNTKEKFYFNHFTQKTPLTFELIQVKMKAAVRSERRGPTENIGMKKTNFSRWSSAPDKDTRQPTSQKRNWFGSHVRKEGVWRATDFRNRWLNFQPIQQKFECVLLNIKWRKYKTSDKWKLYSTGS